MSVSTFEIQPTFGNSVRFSGERVSSCESAMIPPLFGRHCQVSTYRRAESGWVLVIEFHTDQENEQNIVQVEQVDNLDELEDALLLCDPTEYVNAHSPFPVDRKEFMEFRKALWHAYDAVILESVHAVRSYQVDHPVAVAVEMATGSKTSRWFPFSML